MVVVADVRREAGVVDHLAHVLEDLASGSDGSARPGLEAVTERVEVAVAAHPRVLVRQPGTAEVLECLQDDETALRHPLCQVVRGADTRDTGTHDQHVEVLHHTTSLVVAEHMTPVEQARSQAYLCPQGQ